MSTLGRRLHALHDGQYQLTHNAGVLHTLLVWKATLTVWALRVPLCAISAVLLRAVDLLWLRVLARCLAGSRLVSDGWKLRTAHLRLHHVWLPVLSWLAWGLGGVLAASGSFLALALLFGLALVLFLLLLGLPFFADLLELYVSQTSQRIAGQIYEKGPRLIRR